MEPSPAVDFFVDRPPSLAILIVEDNPDTAESFARLLGAWGHRCRIIHSGWSVVESALGFRPQVMLVDIALPGMTGYEIARQIRRHPALKNVVLISISGYARQSDRQRSLDNGFDHHMVKPVDFEALQEILASVPSRQLRD